MTGTETVGEMLEKRKKQFEDFLIGCLPQDKSDLVADIQSKTVDEFIGFVGRAVLPYKNNLELVLTVILMQTGLQRKDVSEENIEKLKKYLGYFCEVAEIISKEK